MMVGRARVLGLVLSLVAPACIGAGESVTSEVATPSPSPSLRLTKQKVRSERYEGLAPDARYIKGDATGSFTPHPRKNIRPGGVVRLEGSRCTDADADSVFVTLERVKPLREHAHDVETTHIRTTRFPVGPTGWSVDLRLPKRPKVAEYIIHADCELAGHLYYGSAGWGVYVGTSGRDAPGVGH